MQVYTLALSKLKRLYSRFKLKRLSLLTSCLVIMVAVVGFMLSKTKPVDQHYNVSSEISDSVDLLANNGWASLAGANQNSDGVKVSPLGRAIVNQNGSGGQPNPPVNVSGNHLNVKGDFQLILSSQNAPASSGSFRLYNQAPIIYDEWRYEPSGLQIKQLPNGIDIDVWNGNGPIPVLSQFYSNHMNNTNTLLIKVMKNQIIVLVEGKEVARMKLGKIFNGGSVWFGADSAVGSQGWTIKELTAKSLDNNQISLAKPPADEQRTDDKSSLANLSPKTKRHVNIGAAISLYPLMTDANYRALAINQFNIWTTENELKAQFVHPQPGVYSFNDADKLINIAQANHIVIHGHALVFGEANPKWMQTTPLSDRKTVMDDHIQKVVGHYKGKVAEWDVINEPLSNNDSDYNNGNAGLRPHIWFQAMGASYIEEALKTAHAADPTAKLYINDYGLEADGDRWDAMINLLTDLKLRKVPIDGVGFESHVYEPSDHEDPQILKRHMKQLADMGLLARVSEIDVHGEDTKIQADEYLGVLSACLASVNCSSFSTWGISDSYGSTTEIGAYPLELGDDLLWDAKFQPKPAYYALQNELKNQP